MFHEIIQVIANIPISTYLTIAMIVLLAISIIFGLLRGVRKSFFYVFFYLIGVAFFLFTVQDVTNNLLNFDLSGLGIIVKGVHFTSLAESMPEFLRVSLTEIYNTDFSTMFVKGSDSYNFLMIVLGAVIQESYCIGFIVFFQIIYKIIIWLFWLIFGRLIYKKKVREHGKIIRVKKQRLSGAIMGLIPGFISVVMLFVPISGAFSLFESMTKVNKEDGVSFGELLSEEDYELLQKAVGSYEESLPGQIFNIITSEDGRSLDLYLYDKVITVNFDDVSYNVRYDIENIAAFASEIISTGLFDVLVQDDFTSYDLIEVVDNNEKKLKHAFESLGSIQMINLSLNTSIEFLDSSRIIDDSLELETDSIDYESLSKLNWAGEFAQFGNILMSAVDVLKALPETSLATPVVNLDEINMDVINNDQVLENFVNELFESTLINKASTAGLEYVLGMDQVKKIVGDFNKEELKNINVKDDVLNVVDALKSALNIGMKNFTNIDLKALSLQSEELKNIIDELLTLEVFSIIEDNVLDYAITNYVENNETIAKYIDIDELRKLGAHELKVELGSLIETFGRLGEETELFDVEELDDENAFVNYEALNSKAIKIINDNIDKSSTIQKFMNKAMNGLLVPSVIETEEEYNDLITKDDFTWPRELDILANILEEIELLDNDFSIYSTATSGNAEITLGMLRGIAAKDKLNPEEYYLDQSLLVSEILVTIIDKEASKNEMFADIFNDETLSYGQEIDALTRILVEGNMIKDDNKEVIKFEELENKFDNISDDMLTSLSNNIGDSKILQKVITNSLKDQVSNELHSQMESWDSDTWTREMSALTSIIIDGEMLDENGEIKLDEMESSFEEIGYTQLDALKTNINQSTILQDFMKSALSDSMNIPLDNKDEFDWDALNWGKEIGIIRDVVGSETYQYEDNSKLVWKKLKISELGEMKAIRYESLDLISENINDSKILKHIFKDTLRDIFEDDLDKEIYDEELGANRKLYKDPNDWTDDEWKKEMKSLIYVLKPMEKENAEKENEGYPEGRKYIDVNGLENSFEDKINFALLENVLGYNENNSSITSFIRKLFRIDRNPVNNTYGINHSNVLRKIVRDALEDGINVESGSEGYEYNVDFDSFSNLDYYYEIKALCNVIKNAGLCKPSEDPNDPYLYIELDNLSEELETINKPLIRNITAEVDNSIILRKQFQKNLEETFGYEFTYDKMNSWDDAKWALEMDALNGIVETLDTKDGTEDGEIDMDMENQKIKVLTINKIAENHSSDFVRELMIDAMNPSEEDARVDMTQWLDKQWETELMAIDAIAPSLADNLGYIDFNNVDFENEEGKVEVELSLLLTISSHIHGSTYIQDKLYDTLFTNKEYEPKVAWSENENQWNAELRSLHDVLCNTSYVHEGKICPDNIDFDAGIDMKALNNVSMHINSSTYLQTKLNEQLFTEAEYEAKYPIIEYSETENRWNDEVGALYNVLIDTSYVDANNMVDPNNIDFDAGIDMKALSNISENIHKSVYLQIKLDTALYTEIEYEAKYPTIEYSETKNRWNDEIGALFNVLAGTNYVNNNMVNPNDIDFDAGIDMKALSNISENIHKSVYLQIKLEKALFTNETYKVSYPVVEYKEIKNQWNLEMSALYEVLDETSYVNSNNIVNVNAIDFNTGIDMTALNNTAKNIHNSTYLQTKLNDVLFKDLNYSYTYPNVMLCESNSQWNNEIKALYDVLNETNYVNNNMVNPNDINFDSGINMKALSNIGDNIHNSSYLQIKLETALFNDSRYVDRGVYPTVQYSEIQGRWNKEVIALYNVLNNTSYVVNDEFNPSSLTFDGVINASILNNVGLNIHESTYLQTKLEETIEGLINDNIIMTRSDVMNEYGLNDSNNDGTYEFDLIVNYGDESGAWRTELNTLFGTILDENSGLVDQTTNMVNIENIKIGLNNLSTSLIGIVSDKLGENNNLYGTYGMSKIARLNLIDGLEKLATGLFGGGLGVTSNKTEFEWFDTFESGNKIESDLHDLNRFFLILGATTQEEAINKLANITSLGLTRDQKDDILDLSSYSYYIKKVCDNTGLTNYLNM